jgi:3-isopropylmalate dehydrogenase
MSVTTPHIAVLGGDGIGPEVMAPALEVLRRIEATSDPKFRHRRPRPAPTIIWRPASRCRTDDPVMRGGGCHLLGACGLPARCATPDEHREPQIELRRVDLYAGKAPGAVDLGVPSLIVGADQRGIDLVLIRESTEGLFASGARVW